VGTSVRFSVCTATNDQRRHDTAYLNKALKNHRVLPQGVPSFYFSVHACILFRVL